MQRLADVANGDEKKNLALLAASGGTLLKSTDAFIDSLRPRETGEHSPLFNAARYLGYAVRRRDMLALDVDLRLEGWRWICAMRQWVGPSGRVRISRSNA